MSPAATKEPGAFAVGALTDPRQLLADLRRDETRCLRRWPCAHDQHAPVLIDGVPNDRGVSSQRMRAHGGPVLDRAPPARLPHEGDPSCASFATNNGSRPRRSAPRGLGLPREPAALFRIERDADVRRLRDLSARSRRVLHEWDRASHVRRHATRVENRLQPGRSARSGNLAHDRRLELQPLADAA